MLWVCVLLLSLLLLLLLLFLFCCCSVFVCVGVKTLEGMLAGVAHLSAFIAVAGLQGGVVGLGFCPWCSA